jgi:hypothetical protein
MATDVEKLAPIYTAMGPHLAAPPVMHNVAFDTSGLKTLLEGGTMQMVTVEGISIGEKGKEVGTIVAALNDCSSCRGVEVGEIVGAPKTFVIVIGWEGPVSEEEEVKRGAEWWTNKAAKLELGPKVEMHNVKFVKCY